MRQTTNLAWPTTPFGASQRPFGKSRPMLAALTLTTAGDGRLLSAGMAYLACDSTRTLALNGTHGQVLRFGYEVMTLDRDEPAEVLAREVDARLVACRREAKYLGGHDLAGDLEGLAKHAEGGRHVPGIDSVGELWADRTRKGRAVARMVDTAHDPVPSALDLDEACMIARLHSHHIGEPSTRATITEALCVALIAARHTGRYDWAKMLDLDDIVTEAAWDQLTKEE
ncbi:hypothetical protein [Nocardia sp. bgisy118]|uniref:hypothetical protein n=1 Tax=Nocardia sp. bgisy118 TaxID=3413786 RepID=UPI003F4A0F97